MIHQPLTPPKDHVNILLDNLIRKIRNFAVLDQQGQLIGRVKDLILDFHHQLNLMVSQISNHQHEAQQTADNNHYFLLPSKLIKKIDVATKVVFLDVDQSIIKHMNESSHSQIKDDSQNSVTSSDMDESKLQYQNNSVEMEALEKHTEEEKIRLLGERLIVERSKRKVGDIIVRKQIETRMVQIPVRREKLIVEQISPEHKQLAEIDLSQGEISGIELSDSQSLELNSFDGSLTVSGDFNSPRIASLLLNAIALERNHGCKKVRVTISVEDEECQKKYQEWFERTSIK